MAYPSSRLLYLQQKVSKEHVNPIYDEDEEELDQLTEPKVSSDYYDEFSRATKMDTIYESSEEFVDSSDVRSNEASSSDGTSSARVSADSPSSVLRRSVIAWSEATGLPTNVIVETKYRSFRLHKFPLVSRSGYFKRLLSETMHVKLSDDFPGGSDVFELVASFCYESTVQIDASNVASLRCCAGCLEMSEEYGKGNLCEKTESYLNQVIFCTWVDTVRVLQQCEKLLPFSEEFLIVIRCIDALASSACSHLHHHFVDGDSLEDVVREGRSYVVNDLLQLPFGFFDRLIVKLRKQGLEEETVSQLIIEYLRSHLLDTEAESFLQSDKVEMGSFRKICLLEAIVRLLPLERFAVPLRFLFSLHGCALEWGASAECKSQLEAGIASHLELATIEDFLVSVKASKDSSNVSRAHIDSMQQVVALFMAQQQIIVDSSEILLADRELKTASSYSSLGVSAVAKVWDEFLTEIASSGDLDSKKFSELTEVIPSHIRLTHDQLYKAIHVYFKTHLTLSQTERFAVCRGLNCQKLSREVCMHAVQNELMPLRLIVQAMFMQQLQSRGSSSNEDPSFTSERVASFHRRTATANCETFEQFARKQDDGLPLGLILQRDAAFREAAFLKDDFEATKARLRELEQELFRLKRSMMQEGQPNNSQKELDSNRNDLMDGKSSRRKFAGSCICQLNGIRFGHRITKTFQRLGGFGNLWKAKRTSDERNGNSVNFFLNHSSKAAAAAATGSSAAAAAPDEQDYCWEETRYAKRETGFWSVTPLRSGSFRKAETDNTLSRHRRHTRHHSVS